jgi:hypothetical protein
MNHHSNQPGPWPTATPAGAAAAARGCRAVAATVADTIDALVAESACDGMISAEKVRRIIRSVTDGQSALVGTLRLQEDRCRAAFRPNPEALKRSDPYRRLVTRPIEYLLVGEDAPFPRRFLPNYFEVVDQALDSKRDHIRDHAEAIYHGLRLKHGGGTVWDTFFADPRTERLLVHVLHRLARFVDAPLGQWTWPLIMSRASPDGGVPTPEQTDRLRAAVRLAWQGVHAEEAARGAAR